MTESTQPPAESVESTLTRFAMVPESLLDSDVSDRAVRLFALLLRYANRGGKAWPSRATLADRLRCSVDSVDRAVSDLVRVGAVQVQARHGRPGEANLSNVYLLREPTPSRTPAATPSRTGAQGVAAPVPTERKPLNESQQEQPLLLDAPRSSPHGSVVTNAGYALLRDRLFEDWWAVWPRKVGKRTAAAAYRRALERTTASTLLAAASAYRIDPNREDAYTVHPTTWLNRDGWLDDPLPARTTNDRAARTDATLAGEMAWALGTPALEP